MLVPLPMAGRLPTTLPKKLESLRSFRLGEGWRQSEREAVSQFDN